MKKNSVQGGKNGEGKHDSFGNTSQASKGFLMSWHQKTNMRRKISETLTEEAWDKNIVQESMEYDKNNTLKSNDHCRMTDRK